MSDKSDNWAGDYPRVPIFQQQRLYLIFKQKYINTFSISKSLLKSLVVIYPRIVLVQVNLVMVVKKTFRTTAIVVEPMKSHTDMLHQNKKNQIIIQEENTITLGRTRKGYNILINDTKTWPQTNSLLFPVAYR